MTGVNRCPVGRPAALSNRLCHTWSRLLTGWFRARTVARPAAHTACTLAAEVRS
jgi:hypothetical protein